LFSAAKLLAGSSYEYLATQKPGIDRGDLLQPMPSRLADNVCTKGITQFDIAVECIDKHTETLPVFGGHIFAIDQSPAGLGEQVGVVSRRLDKRRADFDGSAVVGVG
jgi:hypothetical protein